MNKRRIRTILAVGIIATFATLVALTFVSNYPVPADSQQYLARPLGETGASNRVAGIYLNYRLLDTLLEVLVFSVAVLGVRHYLQQSEGMSLPALSESEVVQTAVGFLSPLALLLCTFFAIFGHISPGGGFAAGVIAASGLLYMAIAHGMKAMEARLNPDRLALAEKATLLILLAFVLSPVAIGRVPLTDLLPKGTPGQLLSGGSILIYNILIAMKVFVGAWAVIAVFAQHRGEL
ncbi:cation:proton antiporter [Candidatus Bipolaricaulota bacterium]|nr:cation:proton antiporter [Candidatus Bipolaricaulota bacterium]